jgi:hypothetical protein
MKSEARNENARTLAAALGIGQEQATKLLSAAVAITYDESDGVAAQFAEHVIRLVSRTVDTVIANGVAHTEPVVAELVIGSASPRFKAECLFAGFGRNEVVIGPSPNACNESSIHPVGLLLGACYAVGAILKKVFGEQLPFPSADVLRINLEQFLGDDLSLIEDPIFFDEAYLAGAGAIGNGFLYGLSQFKVEGILHIVDDDDVTAGNLQRCVFFTDDDILRPKVEQLCSRIKDALPGVQAIPHKMRLQDVPARKSRPSWLKRLIVGVDSPRARRSLQSEIPGEVFDASTTEINEVVLHFHRQPTDLACMSCIYYESPQEFAHERQVAEVLGVGVEEVKQERISSASAKKIHQRYAHTAIVEFEGLAYDTLFKRLCSTGQLTNSEGRRVLAPFAFVSVLAGTLLAIEFACRIQNLGRTFFNVWHISPWTNPVWRRRHLLPKKPECEFCGNPILARIAKEIWSNR